MRLWQFKLAQSATRVYLRAARPDGRGPWFEDEAIPQHVREQLGARLHDGPLTSPTGKRLVVMPEYDLAVVRRRLASLDVTWMRVKFPTIAKGVVVLREEAGDGDGVVLGGGARPGRVRGRPAARVRQRRGGR